MLLYNNFVYHSSSSKATKNLIFLMHERRVIFILLLLGILFYVDNIYGNWTTSGVVFPDRDYVYIYRLIC